MRFALLAAFVVPLVGGIAPHVLLGQGTIRQTHPDSGSSCHPTPSPAIPTVAQRRAAQDLANRAQEASIVEDNTTARTLYERAEKLDATDPTTAYALGRVYEMAGDPRALSEYCRFLSLAPTGSEATDVRQRVETLSSEIAARIAAAASAAAAARSAPATSTQSAGATFALGLLFPGFGQYYTHRPVTGVLFTAAGAGALLYAAQSNTVTTSITRTAVDPNGKSYQYQDVSTHGEHPNAATGLAIAGVVSVIGAVEAYIHVRGAGLEDQSGAIRDSRASRPVLAAVVPPSGRGVGLGLTFPLTLQ